MIGDFLTITLPEVLQAFHFIRPVVLILLPVVAFLWWRIRFAAQQRDAPAQGIAPHLQEALTVGETGVRRIMPIDGVALALVLTTFAAAGPTWSRMPDPFVSPTAPVVIVLKNTASMVGTDVAPSRLERARFKIRDLLEMRAGARTALVTYAGTAHRVVPFTEDAQIMLPYLEGLTPEVMPQEGSNARAALALAVDMLAEEDAPGGILFLLDDLDPADAAEVTQAGANAVVFHAILPEGTRSRGLDAVQGAPVIPVSADDSDLRQIERTLNAAYRAALLETSSQPWQDRGWILAVPAALLCLIWFRRGWTMKWAMVLVFGALFAAPQRATAEGVMDWFFTPDQQGQLAYNRRDFAGAGELYRDPMWQGFALYRAGQYDKAVEVLGRLETADAAFVQGVAHLRNRQYRDGVRAFETVLQRDPDYPGAAENLATAQEIVDFTEELREQSDTGEDTGIGADDTVFDNEESKGVETELETSQDGDGLGLLTTEQWMNTVDTRTGDFLRQRFLLEASQAERAE